MGIAEELTSTLGDLMLFVADQPKQIAQVLRALRLELAQHLSLVPEDSWQPLWVNQFPLR